MLTSLPADSSFTRYAIKETNIRSVQVDTVESYTETGELRRDENLVPIDEPAICKVSGIEIALEKGCTKINITTKDHPIALKTFKAIKAALGTKLLDNTRGQVIDVIGGLSGNVALIHDRYTGGTHDAFTVNNQDKLHALDTILDILERDGYLSQASAKDIKTAAYEMPISPSHFKIKDLRGKIRHKKIPGSSAIGDLGI